MKRYEIVNEFGEVWGVLGANDEIGFYLVSGGWGKKRLWGFTDVMEMKAFVYEHFGLQIGNELPD